MKEELNDQNKPAAPYPNNHQDGYVLASGLLWQDRKILLPLYILLILPGIIGSALDTADPSLLMILSAFERFLQLAFLYVILTRWFRRLSVRPFTIKLRSFCLLIAFGFSFWIMFTLPVALTYSSNNESIKLFSLFLLVPTTLLAMTYYFYFFPIVLNVRSVRSIMQVARGYFAIDRGLALRTIISPLGVMSLAISLSLLPAPDGRIVALNYFSDLFGGLYWLLSTYLGLAFGLIFFPLQNWREAGFDPYREARLATLKRQARPTLTQILTVRYGLTLLCFSIFIWCAISLRLDFTPPAPQLTIQQVEIEEKLLRITLKAQDTRYKFRGFSPSNFALAGEKRTVVSNQPEKSWLNDKNQDVRALLPSTDQEVLLHLEFVCLRSGEELAALEDLYLWYRQTKLMKLDLSKALIITATTH